VLADRLVGAVSENLLGAMVEVHYSLRLVHRDDRVGGDLQDAREFRFRGTEGLVGRLLASYPGFEAALSRKCGDERRANDEERT
jgi:hypothetical protein